MSTAKIQPSSCTAALSTTIKHLTSHTLQTPTPPFLPLFFTTTTTTTTNNNNYSKRHGHGRGLILTRRRNLTVAMSSASSPVVTPLEVCVKASITTPNKLGDCPFCQRVLLTLEEKHLPYDMKLIEFANKPEWFLKVNPEGKVPVVKLDEKWVADSDVITQSLEEKFPIPSLQTPPEKTSVGSKIFSTFIGFLKSKDPGDGTEQALVNELTAFNDYIKENGPFINGKEVSGADLALGPKLYHMEIALGHYKKWSVPDSLPFLKTYMKTIFAMDSFVKTRALTEDVIEGWRPKVMG